MASCQGKLVTPSKEIQECEERLKEAMLQSNVSELNELLADDLMFTNHLGQIMTKQDDIEAHRSKELKINELVLTEQKIKTNNNMAVVTVKAHIKGSFNGVTSESDFRFTRVWSKTQNEIWEITAGHSSMVA